MTEKEFTGKWQTSVIECNKCGYKQVSVHPITYEYLECGMCGHMNPAPFYEESLNQ